MADKKQPSAKKIPTWVNVIGIYYFVIAALTVIVGILVSTAGTFGSGLLYQFIGPWAAGLAALAVFFGIMLIILGILYYFIAVNFRKGKNWARITAIVFGIIGLIGAITSMPSGLVGFVINGWIVYYLFQKEAKAYFA